MSRAVELLVDWRIILQGDRRYWDAIDAGQARHRVDASDSRGAGTNEHFHMMGAMGEACVLQVLGLDRPPKALDRADPAPDITECQPHIEVKCGSPLVWRRKIRRDALYVVVEPIGPFATSPSHMPEWTIWAREYRFARMAMGSTIQDLAITPDKKTCPRPGTDVLNWLIPESLQSARVWL